MAKDKKSFLLYCDILTMVETLPNDKAGELFKHILRYVNDQNPISNDLIINISFEPIKQSLKRDLIKYEKICERNRKNGSKGGRPNEKTQKKPNKPKKPNGYFGNPTKPKKADSDSDSDSDITNSINYSNSKDSKKKTAPIGAVDPKKFNFIDSIIQQFKESYEKYHNNFYEIISIGKERKHCARILGEYKKKQTTDSPTTLIKLREYFDLCNNIPDGWMRENMSLGLIVSKFNEINNILRNGKQTGKNNSGAGIDQIAELIHKSDIK